MTQHKLFFSIITIVGILILCECALQAVSAFSPKVASLLARSSKIPLEVEDEILAYRPNPQCPDHDRKGFRNKSVPSRVCAVAMGDSQTYGMGVKAGQAWPQQLEKLAKITTYNMAFGAYGPTHSLLLWGEAVALKPMLIIEAFYAGNDLFDSYHLVYNRNHLLHLKSTKENVLRALADAELREELTTTISRLFCMGKNKNQAPEPIHASLKEFIAEHLKLYGILRIVRYWLIPLTLEFINPENYKNALWKSIKLDALKNPNYIQILEKGAMKTVLTPDYRLCALNLDDPRIAEGHRIALEAIRLMNERAQQKNIKFLVLLIPTKILVFKELVLESSAEMPCSSKTAIEYEELFWKKTRDFLENHGITFVDALPILRKCIASGSQPYPMSGDGHPNAIGHRAIAESVLSSIRTHNLLGTLGS
jgi:lysophospholipase L1-like esterase